MTKSVESLIGRGAPDFEADYRARLRDEFALAALPAAMMREEVERRANATIELAAMRRAAEISYDMAEEMIDERARRIASPSPSKPPESAP